MIAKGTKVTINPAGAWTRQFAGQSAMAGDLGGASGKTQAFDLTAGGRIFLTPDEYKLQ